MIGEIHFSRELPMTTPMDDASRQILVSATRTEAEGHNKALRNGTEFTLELLDAPEAGCMPLTYGRFWFHWIVHRPDWLAVVARDGKGEIAGLALLSEIVQEEGQSLRRLLSLSVDSAARGRGLGQQLLLRAEDIARERDTEKLFASYSDRMTSRPHFERTLAAAGWDAPEPAEYTIVGQAKWVRSTERTWRALVARVGPMGFSTTPWTETTPADHMEIETAIANGEAPPEWHPDIFLRPGSEPFSLLMRYHGKIVGWIIGEKDGPNCVHYRRGCLFPPYRKYGFLIAGLYEACRRQAEILGDNSVCVNWASAGSDMARFMQTRLLPLIDQGFAPLTEIAKADGLRARGYLDIRYAASRTLV